MVHPCAGEGGMHAPLLAGGFAPAALVAQPEPLPHTVRVDRAAQLSAQGCLATPAELAVAMVRRLQRRRVADISRLRGGASSCLARRRPRRHGRAAHAHLGRDNIASKSREPLHAGEFHLQCRCLRRRRQGRRPPTSVVVAVVVKGVAERVGARVGRTPGSAHRVPGARPPAPHVVLLRAHLCREHRAPRCAEPAADRERRLQNRQLLGVGLPPSGLLAAPALVAPPEPPLHVVHVKLRAELSAQRVLAVEV
mmetsp:Transcript_9198/g.23303  ORF Transcript_9198/g.23303 Transcript_9198/m.23303 type:complete len:252 (+) Transcript_9198:117-872(+)